MRKYGCIIYCCLFCRGFCCQYNKTLNTYIASRYRDWLQKQCPS